jgi:hypothetical protein
LNPTGKRLLGQFYRMPATVMLTGTADASVPVVFAYGRVLAPVRWGVNSETQAPFTTSFTQLTVSGLPAAAHISLACSGNGCPFSRHQMTPRKQSVNLTRLLSGHRLARGTRLTLVISAPNDVAKVVTYVMRTAAIPSEIIQCLPPGYRHPAACS